MTLKNIYIGNLIGKNKISYSEVNCYIQFGRPWYIRTRIHYCVYKFEFVYEDVCMCLCFTHCNIVCACGGLAVYVKS